MKKLVFLFLSIVLVVANGLAQHHEVIYCGQAKAREILFHQHPQAAHDAAVAEQQDEAQQAALAAARGGSDTELYIIPVVFHVIHDNGIENISDEQIYDAINVLTRDFRKQNADTSEIIEEFQDIDADCHIEFRLATIDPDGNCHPGINRIVSDYTYDGYADEMKELSYWPRDSYLNIWVVNTIGGNTAGYSYTPSSVNSPWSAGDDGVVIKSNYVGSIGTSNTSRSRTLTHEVGHYLNLRHVWGPTNDPGLAENCEEDDNVTDTPNCIGVTSCNLDMAGCEDGELENVQNYMDYSYCSNMFTYGQRTRMRNALNSNTAQRNQLHTQANLIATGALEPALCQALFTSANTSICVGTTVQFTDLSFHNVSEWNWNFGDGQTLSGTDPLVHKNPQHVYNTPGVYTITLTAGNGTDEVTTSINQYITVYASGQNVTPFAEGFESDWPANNWSIFNQYNDETFEVTPTAAYTGDKSLKLRNYNNTITSNKDILYTATYNLTGATVAYIDYKWAFACKIDETDDILRISVSGDCGATWSVRKIRKGLSNLPTDDSTNAQFTPTNQDQWDGETITLTNAAWFNENFRVKFEFEGRGGNNLFLDDINITSDAPVGVAESETQPLLYQVYPNPASTDMVLQLNQTNSAEVSVKLYDATGKLCAVVYDNNIAAGQHLLNIAQQPAGLYLLVIQRGDVVAEHKLVFR